MFACSLYYKFKSCNVIYSSDDDHKCHKWIRSAVMDVVMLKPHKHHKGDDCKKCIEDSNKSSSYITKYLFFYYKTMQETGKANLIIVTNFVERLHKITDNHFFCIWLITKRHCGYTNTKIINYGKRYDAHFILKYPTEWKAHLHLYNNI